MPKPLPPYIERIKAMVPHEVIVIKEQFSDQAVRIQAKRINPRLKVKRVDKIITVTFPPEIDAKQAKKQAERLNKLREADAKRKLLKDAADITWD